MTAAAIKHCRILKVNAELIFHKPKPAERKLYVILPQKLKLKKKLRLPLFASYGPVKANSKRQFFLGTTFKVLGLEHLSTFP